MSQDDTTPHDENPAVEQPSPSPTGATVSSDVLSALPMPDPDHPVDKSDVIGEAGRWLAGGRDASS